MSSILLLLACLLEPDPSEAEREASLAAMQAEASRTEITAERTGNARAEIVPTPLFRYSDEQRKIADATLWAFHDHGRPVAFLKVERYPTFPRPKRWLFCFASLSPDKIQARWPEGHAFQAKAPGLDFQPMTGPEPLKASAGRLTQLRQAARRFGSTLIRSETGEPKDQMRLMPTPLHRYSSEKYGIVDGAVFGLSGTGTNPDALVAIQVEKTAEGPRWAFGIGRMTLEGLAVRLDDKEVWTCEFERTRSVFDTWTHFHPSIDAGE